MVWKGVIKQAQRYEKLAIEREAKFRMGGNLLLLHLLGFFLNVLILIALRRYV
jgi:hypothetical protein